MAILTASNLTKSFGEKIILDDTSFYLDEHDKVGIIGVNGTGKTTFLNILNKDEFLDDGSVIVKNGVKISYLSQSPTLNEDLTILQNIFLDTNEEDKVILEFEAKTILTKMGFTDFSLNTKTLSGGEKKRVFIAKVLVNPCDILILDEPTNHLDNDMILWLEDFLKSFRGAVIMVTHDRYFLDRVVNKIVELDDGKIYTYTANYSKFLELKAGREEAELATKRKNRSFYRNELEWASRGPQGRGTKSRVRLQRFENLDKGNVVADDKMEINAITSRLGKKTIEIKNISKSFDDRLIVNDFSYIIDRDARVGIVGENGRGKSTLVKLITGQLQPDTGSIDIGQTVKIGVISQDFVEPPKNMRVIDYIKEVAEVINTDEETVSASKMLERFLFDKNQQYALIETLSGGEKRRLNLLRVLMGAPNLLFLDEPTNDLDILTLTILEDYLQSFKGAVITISHDRYFLDKVVDVILEFQDDQSIKKYNGGYSDYLEQKNNNVVDTNINQKQVQTEPKRSKSQKLKFTYNEQREFDTIDEDLENLENKLVELAKQMELETNNYEKLLPLMNEKEETEKLLEEKMERWVYLNDLNEKINSQK